VAGPAGGGGVNSSSEVNPVGLLTTTPVSATLIGDPAANANDDGAIVTDKTALLPGVLASFSNYSGYSRGINGIMIDIADAAGTLTLADFAFAVGNTATPETWSAAPAPDGFEVRAGAGAGGSDRITITWADGAIQKQWLQVTVLATANTGLAEPDVHYWGTLTGMDPGDQSGSSLSDAGDVNGDGFDDLLIGAPRADQPGAGERDGESYLVFGKSSGFASSLALSNLNGSNGFILTGSDGDHSGVSVSSLGGVNGDGIDDVIIGAVTADQPGGTDHGASYVVFGTLAGFPSSLALSSLDGTNGFELTGIDPGDRAGTEVSSVGDVNGDGLDDMLVADNDETSYVVFGQSAGFTSSLSLSSLDGTNGFVITSEPNPIDWFSSAVNTTTPGTWAPAPAHNGFDIRPGEGVGGSDRVTFTWADGAIQKLWLQVTVLATANTGLAADDVHYWGNQVGETGNDATTAVNAADSGAIVNNPTGFTPTVITNSLDVDHSGFVNAADTGVVVNNPTGFSSLLLFTPPTPAAPVTASSVPDEPEFVAQLKTMTVTTVEPELIIRNHLPTPCYSIATAESQQSTRPAPSKIGIVPEPFGGQQFTRLIRLLVRETRQQITNLAQGSTWFAESLTITLDVLRCCSNVELLLAFVGCDSPSEPPGAIVTTPAVEDTTT
jgi:hypothetical protein